jgi:hypothetical protein
MIYTLITIAQDWLNEQASASARPLTDPAAERRKQLEAQEARMVALRAHGTMVTPESFAEWKASFDAEMGLAGVGLGGDAGVVGDGASGRGKRLTGKQWFMQQEQHGEVSGFDVCRSVCLKA